MKTIEERAEEYAKSVINSTDDQLMTNDEIMRCAEHDFTIGAEFGYQLCNAEWKEKTRWIPVEERLPEFNKEILFKTNDGLIHVGDFKGYFRGDIVLFKTNDYIGYKFTDVTHWKEII